MTDETLGCSALYAVCSSRLGGIKVGYSTRVRERLAGLQREWGPFADGVVLFVPGAQVHERYWHHCNQHRRLYLSNDGTLAHGWTEWYVDDAATDAVLQEFLEYVYRHTPDADALELHEILLGEMAA